MKYLIGLTMMMTALSYTTAHAEVVKWPGKGNLVDIELCKKAVKKGYFIAELADERSFSRFYQLGNFLYRQTFASGFNKLSCKRWAEGD